MVTVFTMKTPATKSNFVYKTRATVRVEMDNSRTARDFEQLMRTTVYMRDEDKRGVCVHCGRDFEASYIGEQVCKPCR